MNELKAYPFCGGEVRIVNFMPHRPEGYWQGLCSKCGVRTKYLKSTEDVAIAINRRATPENKTNLTTEATCAVTRLPCCDCTPCCGSRREDTENKPLTLEQFDTLDGEPVYIVDTYHGGMPHWAIWDTAMIDNDEARSYGKTWLAYARKRRNHEN